MLLFSMLFVMYVALMTSTGLSRALVEHQAAIRFGDRQRVFYVAEGGLDVAFEQYKQLLTSQGNFPDLTNNLITAPTQFPEFLDPRSQLSVLYLNGPVFQTISSGTLSGLNAWSRRFRITSGVHGDLGGDVTLTQECEATIIPVFQFAIFSNSDLVFTPGPSMTVEGPFYVNGTLTLQSMSTLRLHGPVITTRDFLHTTTAETNYSTGDVLIRDSAGNDQNMKNIVGGTWDNTWLDSSDPNWATKSQTRWGGTIRTGAPAVELPVPQGVDPVEIIRPPAAADDPTLKEARLYNQADVRIMDGSARASDGSLVALPSGLLKETSFYDDREQKTVCSTDVDVNVLRQSTQLKDKLRNGILYVGDAWRTCPGGGPRVVRLMNGSALPSKSDGFAHDGLTIATHHPLYVKGSFNTVAKKPAALMADAVTLLSNEWSDANSTKPVTSRVVSSAVTLNAAVMGGRTLTNSLGGGGGRMNHLIRLLEDWDGRRLNYKGSEVGMWTPHEATGDLRCCKKEGGAYSPPARVWEYDTSYQSNPSLLPPGTPTVRAIIRSFWSD